MWVQSTVPAHPPFAHKQEEPEDDEDDAEDDEDDEQDGEDGDLDLDPERVLDASNMFPHCSEIREVVCIHAGAYSTLPKMLRRPADLKRGGCIKSPSMEEGRPVGAARVQLAPKLGGARRGMRC